MSTNTPERSDTARLVPLLDPDSIVNPYPRLAELRARGTVVPVSTPSGLGVARAWLVTQMEAAVQVLKDPRFVLDPSRLGPVGQQQAATLEFFGGRTLNNVDGPDHTRLRGLVSRVFTPRYIQTLRPAIQAIADMLLDRVEADGRMDLVRDFGHPLPITVISDMLGVPPHQRELLGHWSNTISGIAVGALDDQITKLSELADFVRGLIAEKRQRPQEDLLSRLIALEADGDRLSEQELVALVTLLIFAGHETTAKMIELGVLDLLDHPAQFELLKAEPGLVPQAVEEILRFSGPVLLPGPRFAAEDVELGGQRIRRGEMVMVSLAGASHDPAAFTDPEEFAIAREISNQIAFGQGVHICLGAPLARLEAEIAFTTLLRRLPNLRLDIPREQIAWQGSLFLRGLRSLPVAF